MENMTHMELLKGLYLFSLERDGLRGRKEGMIEFRVPRSEELQLALEFSLELC